MKAYTDYPFTELGDEPYKQAPIRSCTIKQYDGNKYCKIDIAGHWLEVKLGYLHRTKIGVKKNRDRVTEEDLVKAGFDFPDFFVDSFWVE